MNASAQPLEELVKQLPPDVQAEVRDFVEFLLERRRRKAGAPLRQDWAGALREYREQYTSLELQQFVSIRAIRGKWAPAATNGHGASDR